MIRNILCYKNRLGTLEKIIITVLSVTLSLIFNNLGLIGLLPVVSTITYVWLMNEKDVIKFKYFIMFTMLLWVIYDLTIKSYTSCAFDFLTIISNTISIYKINKKSKEMN